MPTIIKTMIPFSENYLPPDLVDRSYEKQELTEFLKPLTNGQPQAYNLLVTGTVGVGKTVLTRFIIRELPAMSCYIKLSEADNTFPRVLFKIVNALGLPISPYTHSNIVLMKLLEHFENSKTATLIVFDDFEKAPITALRCLLHEIPRGTSFCNFLLISRVPAVLDGLPEDTKSTLRCHELPLHPYGKETLFEILCQRAKLALNDGTYSEDILDEIAKNAALSGSAREALEVLKISAIIAERFGDEKIDQVALDWAYGEIERRSLEATINHLPKYHKIILEICQLYPQPYEQVYAKWRGQIMAQGLKPLSIYRFRDFVSDLKKLDLIQLIVKGRGRGAGFSYGLALSPHVGEFLRTINKLKISF